MGVYNIQANTQALKPVVSPFTGLGLTQEDRQNHTLSLSEVHLFSPTLINQAPAAASTVSRCSGAVTRRCGIFSRTSV